MKKYNKFKNIFKSTIAIIMSIFIISEIAIPSFSYALESSESKENIQTVQSNVMDKIIKDECGENCSHVYRDLDDNLQPICKKGVDIINNKKSSIKRTAKASGSFAGQGVYLVKLDDVAKNLGNIGLGKNKIEYVDANFLQEKNNVNEKTFRMYKMGGTQEPTYSTVVPDDENGVRYNRVYFTIHFKDNTINPTNTLITNFTAEVPDSEGGKLNEIREKNSAASDFKERYEGNILLTPKARNCLYVGTSIYKSFWSGNPSAEGASLRNQILYVDNRMEENNQKSFWPISKEEDANNTSLYISYRAKVGVDSNGDYKYEIITDKISQYTNEDHIRYYKFPADTRATERSLIIVSNKPPSKIDNSFPDGTNTYMFLYNTSDLDNCLVTRYLGGVKKEDGAVDEGLAGEGLKRNFIKYSPSGNRKIMFRDRMDEYVNSDELQYNISKDGSNWDGWKAMQRVTDGDEIDKKTLWTTPEYSDEYKKIQFRVYNKGLISYTVYSTEVLDINQNFAVPVFFADVFQDPYTFSGFYRTSTLTGSWVRRIENNNHGDIIKNSIPVADNNEKVNQQYMAKATFYDYYSDIELKGVKIKSASGYTESKQAGIFNYAVEEYYRGKERNKENPDNLEKENIMYEATNLDEKIDETYRINKKGYLNRNKKPKTVGQEGNSYSDNQEINIYKRGLYYSSGVVDNTLNSNDEMTQNGSDYVPQFNEGFLRGDNAIDTNLGAVYPNVDFGFKLNEDGYWEFNSLSNEDAKSILKYDKEKGYYMGKSSDPIKYDGTNSFLPFDDSADNGNNRKNHLFGMKMSIPFRSTETGTIKTNKINSETGKNEQDVIFKFTGDDDLWLFIDDKLALDLGGIHDAITGEINFNSGEVITYIEPKTNKSTIVYQKNIYTEVLREKIIAKYGDKAKDNLNEYGKKYLAESEHNLNVFYMERGLEKSNLRMVFNFPTKNMLSVSNDIDTSAASEFFNEALDTLGGINYFLKNQVTVGESLDVEKSAGFIGAGKNIVFNDINLNSDEYISVNSNVQSGIESSEIGERSNTLKYTPSVDMPDWADKNTIKKYLVSIKSALGDINIDNYAYLKFDAYSTNETSATGTELYVQVTDVNGNNVGDWASNLTYKSYSNTLPQEEWVSERISINKLKTLAGSNVDFKKIRSIDIGYIRKDKTIYLDDFKFYEEMVVNDEIGFSIQDREISDYKSLEGLNPIDYSKAKMSFVDKAWYMLRTKYTGSSNYNEGVPFSVENGMFGLANGQKAEFVNKFRLGTYLQLEQEDLNNKIFDTTWTLKEENKEIDTNSLAPNKSLETVINDSNVEGLNDRVGYNVGDGRTVLKNGTIINSNADSDSSGNKKETFVFRRFDNPDDKAKEGVNLNVEYKNTLKVGGIYLTKKLTEPAKFNQKFRFHIHYRNIAGRYLEENIHTDSSDSKTDLVQNVEVIVPKDAKEASILIDGIPAGTDYTIHEVNNTPIKDGIETGKCYKYEYGNLTSTEETDENKKHTNVGKGKEIYTGKNEETGEEVKIEYDVAKGTVYNSTQSFSFTNEGYKDPNGAIRITKNLLGTTYTDDKDFMFHVHYKDKEGKEFVRRVSVTVPAGKTVGTAAVQNIPVERDNENKRTFGAPYWIHEVDESNLTGIEEGKTYVIGTLGENINDENNILNEADPKNKDNLHTDRNIYFDGKLIYGKEEISTKKCDEKIIDSYAEGKANTSQKEYIFKNSGPVSIAIRKSTQYGKPLAGAGFSVYKKETDKETFIKEVRTSYYEKKVVPKKVPEGEYYDENTNRYNDGTGTYIVYDEENELYYYKPLTPSEIADYEEGEVLGDANDNRIVETLAAFDNLTHGTYRVDETTIPSGYRKVDTQEIDSIELPKKTIIGTKNVNDAIFSVINYDKYILPTTGRGRILKWIVLGMALVAIGAGIVISRNKKEEGDN